MRLIALDPGGTTGVARLFGGIGRDSIEVTQLGPHEHHQDLWIYLETAVPEVVICERFMYQRREVDKGVALNIDAREYIGIAKLWCLLNDAKFVLQTPAQAKNLWKDDKLKKIGLYSTNARHANDATRHLLYFLTVTLGDRHYINLLRPEGPPQQGE